MSVINKMLQDLEKRQQASPEKQSGNTTERTEFVRPTLQYQAAAEPPKRFSPLVIIAILLLPTIWFGMKMLNTAENTSPSNIETTASDKALSNAEPEAAAKIDNDIESDFGGVDVSEQESAGLTDSKVNSVEPEAAEVVNTANVLENDQAQIVDNAEATATEVVETSTIANVNTDKTLADPRLNQVTSVSDVQVDAAPKTAMPDAVNSESQDPVSFTQASTTSIAANSVNSKTAMSPTVVAQSTSSKPVAVIAKKSGAETAQARPDNKTMRVKEVHVSKQQQAQVQFKKAIAAEKELRQEDAASLYLEAIILDPSLHEARKQLVAIYFNQRNSRTAIRLLESGLGMYPNEFEFYVIMARIQSSDNDDRAAIKSLANIPNAGKWTREKWIVQTEIGQKTGQHALVEEAYRALLKLESTQARWWMGLAYALDSQQEYTQAAQAYRSALNYPGLSSTSIDFIEKRLVQLGENQ